MSAIPAVQVSQAALERVAGGHPWIFRTELLGSVTHPVGQQLRILDQRSRLRGWGLWDEGPIALRVLDRYPAPLEDWLRGQLERALQLRAVLLPADTDCCRLVNGAGDGLPGLVIDRYGSLAVLRLYSKVWESLLPQLCEGLGQTGWAECIIRRYGVRRVDGRQGIELLEGREPPATLVVREHGLRFLVRPREGQKTGLFLDQRAWRRRVRELVREQRVLNLFSYSGGFSVYAAAAGARRVCSVDFSPGALEDARENFRLNGLPPEEHEFIEADIFQWTPDAEWDWIICDPPHLTRSQKSDHKAARAYSQLAQRVGEWVPRPRGALLTFSCSARLSGPQWERAVHQGLRRRGRWALLERAEAPWDHPCALAHAEGRYLKGMLLRPLS